jgi:hypothetical protein
MMPKGLQPWQRKAIRNSWQHSKWAVKYAELGLADDAARAAIQAVKFYHHVFPGAQ